MRDWYKIAANRPLILQLSAQSNNVLLDLSQPLLTNLRARDHDTHFKENIGFFMKYWRKIYNQTPNMYYHAHFMYTHSLNKALCFYFLGITDDAQMVDFVSTQYIKPVNRVVLP